MQYKDFLKPIHTICIDMDVVIVDLEKSLEIHNPEVVNFKEVFDVANIFGQKQKLMKDWLTNVVKGNGFETAPPLPFLKILVEDLIPYWKSIGIEIKILSSITSSHPLQSEIATQKLRWLKNNGLGDIKLILVKGSSKKQEYASEGCLLLDDYFRNIAQFIKAGGYGIQVVGNDSDLLHKLDLIGLIPSKEKVVQ